MKSYFGDLEKRADDCYNLVSKARKAGFDPALEPEIPRAKDLAERVEARGISGSRAGSNPAFLAFETRL
jgi:hypothetical protein